MMIVMITKIQRIIRIMKSHVDMMNTMRRAAGSILQYVDLDFTKDADAK